MVRDLPQGLPRPGDRGLDHTGTWASTYWGGAVWCLLAELEIRERTGNRLGLRDAVRAIAADGGMTHTDTRPLADVLAIGDRALGTPALTDTWIRIRDAPVAVDLEVIWRDLGIERGSGGPDRRSSRVSS